MQPKRRCHDSLYHSGDGSENVTVDVVCMLGSEEQKEPGVPESMKGEIMERSGNAFDSVDEYIRGFPTDVQRILNRLREAIRKAAPDAEEKISYRMPTFVLHGNLVHFAAYRNHIGFYPTSSGIEAFKQELSAYKWSKGSVQFPIDKPLPYELVRRIVRFRVAETSRLAEEKLKKKVHKV
jgi:uncharacterized protein YdhG (YjbR/CyaY superfamily)